MRIVVVIGLVIVMLFQAWVRTLWALDYQWRRVIYLRKCENKARPQIRCDGKCYLLKQMKASETADDQYPPIPEAFRAMKEIMLFFEHFSWPLGEWMAEKKHRPYAPYLAVLPLTLTHGIFQPPEKQSAGA